MALFVGSSEEGKGEVFRTSLFPFLPWRRGRKPRFFRCDFGCCGTRGNIAHDLLEMLLNTIKRCRERQAFQHDAAGAFIPELREVNPKDNSQLSQRGQERFLDVPHALSGKTNTISEEMRMNPHLFPPEDLHVATPLMGFSQGPYLLAAAF